MCLKVWKAGQSPTPARRAAGLSTRLSRFDGSIRAPPPAVKTSSSSPARVLFRSRHSSSASAGVRAKQRRPYLLDVTVAREGVGAEATWYDDWEM